MLYSLLFTVFVAAGVTARSCPVVKLHPSIIAVDTTSTITAAAEASSTQVKEYSASATSSTTESASSSSVISSDVVSWTTDVPGCQCPTGTHCSLAVSCSISTSSATTSQAARSTESTTTPAAAAGPTMPAKKSGVQFAGINISGGEYGVDSSGTSHPSGSSNAYYYAPGGTEQFAHFFSKGANIFRIPAGWQYLVADKLSGPLDETYMSQYDLWVQACLATGAKCILDVHNYGRWNGQIVGQSNGAVKDEDLMDLWAKLAKRYPQPNIIYEIINEPHDMNEPTWKNTVQKVVHAIRDAGSTSNWILLPGNAWTSAKNWETNSGDLLTVTDSDGSTDRLIIDVHRYMDADGSGTTAECVQNTIDDSLAPLAAVLRRAGRRALLTETGGGNTTSCLRDVCQALAYINQNADVYLGWLGFSAGGFKASDVLDETPNADGSDVPLVQQCILGQFPGSSYYSPVHDTILPRSGPELSVDPLPPHSFANLRVGVVCTSVLIFFLLVL